RHRRGRVEQGALADPGFAHHRHGPRLPGAGSGDRLLDLPDLRAAADEFHGGSLGRPGAPMRDRRGVPPMDEGRGGGDAAGAGQPTRRRFAMTTFLAYTSPAAGHIFPLVPGLLELCRRGHDVHVRTDPALVAGLRRAGLAAEPVDPRIATIKPGGEDGRNGLRAGYRALLRRGALDGPDLERALVETDADVLLVDTLAFGAAVAAERSGM